MNTEEEARKKILSTFANVASSIGYSPVHGEILGTLLLSDNPVSLSDISKEVGYSLSMISLSLDLLEALGAVKKIKKTGDRKLYVELSGSLLEILKRALLVKIQKSISGSLEEFEESKKGLDKLAPKEKENMINKINILETEIKKLDKYVSILSAIKMP